MKIYWVGLIFLSHKFKLDQTGEFIWENKQYSIDLYSWYDAMNIEKTNIRNKVPHGYSITMLPYLENRITQRFI